MNKSPIDMATLQDIVEGRTVKYKDRYITVYNNEWLKKHQYAPILSSSIKWSSEPTTKYITKEQLASAPVDPLMMQATYEQVQEFCKARNLAIIDERLLNSLLGRL